MGKLGRIAFVRYGRCGHYGRESDARRWCDRPLLRDKRKALAEAAAARVAAARDATESTVNKCG